jgi:hypothetical protein
MDLVVFSLFLKTCFLFESCEDRRQMNPKRRTLGCLRVEHRLDECGLCLRSLDTKPRDGCGQFRVVGISTSPFGPGGPCAPVNAIGPGGPAGPRFLIAVFSGWAWGAFRSDDRNVGDCSADQVGGGDESGECGAGGCGTAFELRRAAGPSLS